MEVVLAMYFYFWLIPDVKKIDINLCYHHETVFIRDGIINTVLLSVKSFIAENNYRLEFRFFLERIYFTIYKNILKISYLCLILIFLRKI